ncbi:MAG: C_GCAxxG_C_C family protein [Clostridiales bacterium]|nr:C_GCAxxG_C_C family protein [Clostridiales bacterium]
MQIINKQSKIDKARDLFLGGYNCAQSVFAAYAQEAGLTESQALKLSSGFGGGIGGMRNVCGAITGMMMVVGAHGGYDDAADMQGKKHLYAAEQALVAKFEADFETIECRELLKRNHIVASGEPSERTPEYYKQRPCARYVETCAGMIADELNEKAE